MHVHIFMSPARLYLARPALSVVGRMVLVKIAPDRWFLKLVLRWSNGLREN